MFGARSQPWKWLHKLGAPDLKKTLRPLAKLTEPARQYDRARYCKCPIGPAWSETLACADDNLIWMKKRSALTAMQSDLRSSSAILLPAHGRYPGACIACTASASSGRLARKSGTSPMAANMHDSAFRERRGMCPREWRPGRGPGISAAFQHRGTPQGQGRARQLVRRSGRRGSGRPLQDHAPRPRSSGRHGRRSVVAVSAAVGIHRKVRIRQFVQVWTSNLRK